MLKNYFVVAIRRLLANRWTSAANVAGLALGISFCILSLLYAQHELSFDAFHRSKDRLYRIYLLRKSAQGERISFMTSVPLAPDLEERFPEVDRAARLWQSENQTLRLGEKLFQESSAYVDPGFFRMFSFPRVFGTPEDALDDETTVVISRQLAEKCVGESDPTGQTIAVRRRSGFRDYTIGGVVDIPATSSITYSVFFPIFACSANTSLLLSGISCGIGSTA